MSKQPSSRDIIPVAELLHDEVWAEMSAHHASHALFVLMAGARIEQAMGNVLQKYFVEDGKSKEILTGDNAILGPYGNRNKMCFCLGLISQHTFDNIKTIGYIRNSFAHHHANKRQFGDAVISPYVNKLKEPVFFNPDGTAQKQYWHLPVKNEADIPDDERMRFLWTAKWTLDKLFAALDNIEQKQSPA